MLFRFDERIISCNKSDEGINEKIGKIEGKVDELSKFKWMTAGVIALVLLFVPIINNVAASALNSFIHQVKPK